MRLRESTNVKLQAPFSEDSNLKPLIREAASGRKNPMPIITGSGSQVHLTYATFFTCGPTFSGSFGKFQ